VLICACGISVWLGSRKSNKVTFKDFVQELEKRNEHTSIHELEKKNMAEASMVSMSHQYGKLEVKDGCRQEARISRRSDDPRIYTL